MAVLNDGKKIVTVPRFPKNAHGHTMCAAGGCWLAVREWQLMALGGV